MHLICIRYNIWFLYSITIITRVPEQSLRCDFCDGINVLMVTVKKLSWRSELLLYIGSNYYMLSFETSFVEIGLVFPKILNEIPHLLLIAGLGSSDHEQGKGKCLMIYVQYVVYGDIVQG